jgi:endoglucanase
MDEVALVVTEVSKQGFLRVAPQGLLQPDRFRQQAVTVLGTKGQVSGIANAAKATRRHPFDVWIDVGTHSPEEVAQLGILPGDRVCFAPHIQPLGDAMVTGKAADDRVGLYVLAEVARRLTGRQLSIRLALIGTVQEEGVDTFVAWSGAHVVGRRLSPVAMLGIDTVDARNDSGECQGVTLPAGLAVLRGAQDLHPGLVDHQLARAVSIGMRYKIVGLAATAADYTVIARSGQGIPCAGLGIPVCHTHSASEVFCWQTVEDVVSLLLEIVENPTELCRIAARPH